MLRLSYSNSKIVRSTHIVVVVVILIAAFVAVNNSCIIQSFSLVGGRRYSFLGRRHHRHSFAAATRLAAAAARSTNVNENANVTPTASMNPSDGVTVLESLDYWIDDGDRTSQQYHHNHLTLILGTLPSDKSYGYNLSPKDVILRGGGRGPQNYGHTRNSFWNIVGTAFGFHRHNTTWNDQVKALVATPVTIATMTSSDVVDDTTRDYQTIETSAATTATTTTITKFALWDVLKSARRKGSLDSNIVKGSSVPNDIPRFLMDHPNCNRLVFAANSGEIFAKRDVFGKWLDTGTIDVASSGAKRRREEEIDTFKVFFWMKNEEGNPLTFKRTYQIFGKKKGVSIVSNVEEAEAIASEAKNQKPNNEEDYDDSQVTKDNTGPPRLVELIVLPSTSPANASMRPPEKEKIWHQACFGYVNPPPYYVCPGCQECGVDENHDSHDHNHSGQSDSADRDRHWFADCPYLDEWKEMKKNQKKKNRKTTDSSTTITPDDIDPFDWYT